MFNGSGKTSRKAASNPADDTQAPAGTAFPLFFSKPVAVNPERHGKAGIHTNLAPEFARATNSIPLNVVEFMEAVKFYPVAFTMTTPVMPLAIVGLEQENLFIDEKNQWRDDTYIPAYVRKHPFVFAEDTENDRLTLCVDEDSAYFASDASDNATALFEKGEPTAYTNNVLQFCAAFQEQFGLTRQFCEVIESLGLFEPNRSDVELPSGRKIGLTGFQMIDQKRFSELPDEKIMELHKQGWLPLIHFTFLANSNWRRLLDLAAKREPKA